VYSLYQSSFMSRSWAGATVATASEHSGTKRYLGKLVQCTCIMHEVMMATDRRYNIQQRHERQCQQTLLCQS